jgi:hypothetical protein
MLALLQSPGVPIGDQLSQALNRSTVGGQAELTRLFLSMHANLDAPDEGGNTLFIARLKSMPTVAELLVQGASVHVLAARGHRQSMMLRWQAMRRLSLC